MWCNIFGTTTYFSCLEIGSHFSKKGILKGKKISKGKAVVIEADPYGKFSNGQEVKVLANHFVNVIGQ